jgi:hypothetical protein
MPRPPNSGRKRHIFTYGQTEVLEVLARRGVSPLETIADILADPKTSRRDRIKAAIALLPYTVDPPTPPEIDRATVEAFLATGREFVERCGGRAKALEAMRNVIIAFILETLAACDPQRARLAVLAVRAFEFLADQRPPEEQKTSIEVVFPFSKTVGEEDPERPRQPEPGDANGADRDG